jgi:heme oxygenase
MATPTQGIGTPHNNGYFAVPVETTTSQTNEPNHTYTSSSTISPQIIHADQARQASVFKLSSAFHGNRELHKAVEESPFVKELRATPTKEAYVDYLVHIKCGLEIIEQALSTWPKIDLSSFFRLTALDADITALGGQVRPVKPVIQQQVEHFRSHSQSKPHLLVAHAAMRYYALLFGGQQRRERLEKVWEEAVQLYIFEEDSKTMLTRLSDALNSYGATLTSDEIQEFHDEIQLAWVFTGDIVGTDIRELLQCRN